MWEEEEPEETSGLRWIMAALSLPSSVATALGVRQGAAYAHTGFPVQVFTHLNPDHTLSYVCGSTAVAYKTYT